MDRDLQVYVSFARGAALIAAAAVVLMLALIPFAHAGTAGSITLGAGASMSGITESEQPIEFTGPAAPKQPTITAEPERHHLCALSLMWMDSQATMESYSEGKCKLQRGTISGGGYYACDPPKHDWPLWIALTSKHENWRVACVAKDRM